MVRRLRFWLVAFGLLTALLGAELLPVSEVYSLQIARRALAMNTNIVGQTAQYEIRFNGIGSGAVGSIRLQLCREDPFVGQPCTGPAGLDMTAAVLVSQSGMTGFVIHPSSTANELVLSRTPAAAMTGSSTYTLSGIVNPSAPGTYYGRLETFATDDATGSNSDFGGLAIAILPSGVSVQTVVPPFLLFCIGNTIQPYDCDTAAGNYIDFGNFSVSTARTGQTQMLAATNADGGYTIRALGTTLTSGVNTIPPLTSSDVSRPGVAQFGMNLRMNSSPNAGRDPQGSGLGQPMANYNIPNYFHFNSGDVIAASTVPDEYRLYTASYMVNISKDQAPGIYVTTLMYIALATF